MKKIGCLLVVLIVMAACGKNSPKEVANTWLTGFYHLDYDEARKVSTVDTKNLLSAIQQLSDKVSDSNKKELKNIKVTVKDVKVDGDKAIATYTTSDNPTKEQNLNLIKQDNRWLVQFTKIDVMGVPRKNEEPSPADSTGPAEGSMPDTMHHQ